MQQTVSKERFNLIQKIRSLEKQHTSMSRHIAVEQQLSKRSSKRKGSADQARDVASTPARVTSAYRKAQEAKQALIANQYAALMEACENQMFPDIEVAMFSHQVINEHSGSQLINAYPHAIN